MQLTFAENLLGLPQKIRQRFLRMRAVAAVLSEQKLVVFTQNNELDGCGTDVDSGTVLIHGILRISACFRARIWIRYG